MFPVTDVETSEAATNWVQT